jgi:hypothetical protein
MHVAIAYLGRLHFTSISQADKPISQSYNHVHRNEVLDTAKFVINKSLNKLFKLVTFKSLALNCTHLQKPARLSAFAKEEHGKYDYVCLAAT